MKGNPEIEEAHRLGIPTVERSILLGYVANTYPHPICIAGTHGKTTTTAMTTQIMVMAHADPAAVIGGKLPLIDAYGRYGTGREIVVEACEYSNTFLHLVPYISVLLNVDADHLEFFKTMENLEESFRKFALLTTHTVIANLDDANTVKVIHNLTPNPHHRIDTPGITAPCMCANTPIVLLLRRAVWVCPQCTLTFVPDATCVQCLALRMRHDVRCTADECAGHQRIRGAGRPL
jgi:UDP-N-acetylmuramate--alanine ligase